MHGQYEKILSFFAVFELHLEHLRQALMDSCDTKNAKAKKGKVRHKH